MNQTLDVLKSLGLALPPPPAPGGNYISAQLHGDLLFLAGAISTHEGKVYQGRLGADLNLEQGYFAARCCALTQMAVIQQALGDLDKVKQILSVNGYVCCTPEFKDPPKVINGASDLLVQVFGERGRHVRAAIGVTSLPVGAAVELQMTVAVLT
jgi:enamine deaminase RidA (YjgF/YER057c/UK114 family)